MAKKINQLPTSSITDNNLMFVGDPQFGQLYETSFKAAKDYFTAGITGSGGTVNTGSLATTASLNALSSSYVNDSSSFNSRINSITGSSPSGNYVTTGSFNSFSSSYVNDSASFLNLIESITGSGGGLNPAVFQAYTASTNITIGNVYASESKYLPTSSFYTFTSSYNSTSASFNTRINSITGSGNINTGSFVVTGSLMYNVKNYGVIGNGVADETTALNSLLTAIPDGATIYFPQGQYLVSNTLVINKNLNIRGEGMGAFDVFDVTGSNIVRPTVINYTGTGSSLFLFASSSTNDYPVRKIEDISLIYSGSIVPVLGSSGLAVRDNGNEWTLRNVLISGFYINVDVQAAFYWLMENCRINSPVLYGLQIGNYIDSDIGDWAISNTIFTSGLTVNTGSSGIHWKAGGGGKIVNTKFNSSTYSTNPYNFQYCIIADFSQGPTSDFQCINTSFENFDVSAIYVNAQNTFNHILLNNLQIAPVTSTASGSFAIDIRSINLLTIDNIVAQNYGTAINAPVINLYSVTNYAVGKVVFSDYSGPISVAGGSGDATSLALSSAAVIGGVVTDTVQVKSSTIDNRSSLSIVPNGNSQGADCIVFNTSDTYTNFGYVTTGYSSTEEYWYINVGAGGTQSLKPIFLSANGNGVSETANLVLQTSGLVGVGGVNNPEASVDIVGSNSNYASLRIRSGSAPSAPPDGAIWYDEATGTLKMNISGSIKTFSMT